MVAGKPHRACGVLKVFFLQVADVYSSSLKFPSRLKKNGKKKKTSLSPPERRTALALLPDSTEQRREDYEVR